MVAGYATTSNPAHRPTIGSVPHQHRVVELNVLYKRQNIADWSSLSMVNRAGEGLNTIINNPENLDARNRSRAVLLVVIERRTNTIYGLDTTLQKRKAWSFRSIISNRGGIKRLTPVNKPHGRSRCNILFILTTAPAQRVTATPDLQHPPNPSSLVLHTSVESTTGAAAVSPAACRGRRNRSHARSSELTTASARSGSCKPALDVAVRPRSSTHAARARLQSVLCGRAGSKGVWKRKYGGAREVIIRMFTLV